MRWTVSGPALARINGIKLEVLVELLLFKHVDIPIRILHHDIALLVFVLCHLSALVLEIISGP